MSLPEQIFLTGFPGFIAGRLVARLLADGARFLLLVQPEMLPQARISAARISAAAGVDEANALRLLPGDITRPDLGLSAADLDLARGETTLLFHLAAVYDLAVERELALRVNVEGTRRVNEFARTLARLKRYHYVSTCYVAGRRTGLILESELRHQAGFRNFYEETKYLAEVEVDDLKKELPITIHRPAVVCGDSRTGETAKYDGIYYLIQYMRLWPQILSHLNIGNQEVHLNIVPVDFVVEAMAALAQSSEALGATVHLADPAPLSTHELFETIAVNLAGHGSHVTIPAALVHGSLMLPLSPHLTGMPRAAVPYFFIAQSYDTGDAARLLAPDNVRCPSFRDYAPRLIEHLTAAELGQSARD